MEKRAEDLKGKLDKALAERNALRTERDQAREQIAAAGDRSEQAEQLDRKLAEAEDQLAGRETEIAALKAQTKELRKAVSAAESRATAIDGQRILTGMTVNSLRAEKEKLETENAGLRQTIANLQAARTNRSNDDDAAQAPDESRSEGRRDAAAVREALADLPGFSRMAPDKQTELAERLENGECVVDALKATLGRVPAIALRNLIQDLGRKC